MIITLTLSDMLIIIGIITVAAAIDALCVFALVRHVPFDSEDEEAERISDRQRTSHPEIWP